MKQKTLYFEGAGWSGADISKATIGNCRIRTAFHLDSGTPVYLEIHGSERPRITKENKPYADVYAWQYTGFVTDCYEITSENPNNDCNRHRIPLTPEDSRLEYSESGILRFVNSLGASFDTIKVVPDLGGYHVFPERNSCTGLDGYYYGDMFEYEPELTKKREAVYDYFYKMEKAEGKQYPNFSLWVDEADKYVLHLLRYYSGSFQTAHNLHWLIQLDKKDAKTGNNWTATEQTLGKWGC